MQNVKNETEETATHGQQRGRRQRGEGLAVNTDGIIICVSIVHEKRSQHWSGQEKKTEKRKWEPSLERGDIRRGLSVTPLRVVGLVCFWGNCSGPWGSYLREIQTSISHNMQEE